MGEEKGNVKRYMKTVKQNQMETLTHRNTALKIKIQVHKVSRKLDRIEKRMNEHQGRSIEMIGTDTEKKKK